MKITKALVKQFEEDQKLRGTKLALTNVIWQLAAKLLYDLGVRSISTTYKK